MRRCCSLHHCIKSHALSRCQKRKIHLGVNKLTEGSCPLKCGQILGMAEKRHIWLFGDQKAKYSQAQVTQCPFVAAIGITRLYAIPDFLLWITSSSPSVAAAPPPLVTSSALSLFTCKVLVTGIINSCQGSLEQGDMSLWLVCTVLQCTALLLPHVCALEKPGLLATASSPYWCCSPALKLSLRLGH